MASIRALPESRLCVDSIAPPNAQGMTAQPGCFCKPSNEIFRKCSRNIWLAILARSRHHTFYPFAISSLCCIAAKLLVLF